jgi:hypothetical protein
MFADHPFSGRDLPTLSIAIARGRRWLDEVVAGTVTSGGCFAAIAHSRLWQILLQKSPSSLCEIEICNDRIGARAPLNRCCAFAPDLESMLRDKMLKILLQHNRHQADLPSSHDHVRLARRSGNHLNVLRFPLIAQKTYSS